MIVSFEFYKLLFFFCINMTEICIKMIVLYLVFYSLVFIDMMVRIFSCFTIFFCIDMVVYVQFYKTFCDVFMSLIINIRVMNGIVHIHSEKISSSRDL